SRFPKDAGTGATMADKNQTIFAKGSFGCASGRSSASFQSMLRKPVVVLAVPPVDELDLVGPVEVFATANRLLSGRRTRYAVEIVTTSPDRRIDGEGGLSLVAQRHYQQVAGRPDSVLVVCGARARTMRDRALLGWLGRVAETARRLGSVC